MATDPANAGVGPKGDWQLPSNLDGKAAVQFSLTGSGAGRRTKVPEEATREPQPKLAGKIWAHQA
jgi:hypothetical protein